LPIVKLRKRSEVALALLLVACTRAPVPVIPVATPARGGTLRVVLSSDVDSLDPDRAARPSSWFFVRALHRGLLAFPDEPFPDGARPVPDLAVALPVAEGRDLTFTLRDDVRFGAPADRAVRAADVVASIARVRASGVGIAPALAGIVSVRAPDDKTVVFTLDHARPDLLAILAHPQAAIVPAGTPLPGKVAPVAIAGAGPYRIVSYAAERSLVLARSETWSGDDVREANVDRIEATFGVPAERAYAMAANRETDLVLDTGPPDDPVPPVPSGAHTIAVSDGCVRYLLIDHRVAPLGSVLVREAIAAAVERARLPGAGTTAAIASSILPPFVDGNGTTVAREDVDAARKLLSRAKLPRGFSTTIVAGDSARDRADVEALARSFARVGISLRATFVPPADLYPLWYADRARTVALGLGTWCADYPGHAASGVLGGVLSLRGFPPPSIVRAIAATSATSDPGVAFDADQAIERLALVVPLLWPAQQVVASSEVSGFAGSPMWPRGDPTHLWLGP